MGPKYERLVERFVERSRDLFGENLTGIYLHGSAAMGCFNGSASDLDLIAVVEEPPSREAKRRFMDFVTGLSDDAPAKGIELSVVRRAVCRPFQYPTPYELHFSIAHLSWYQSDPEDYLEKMQGTDRDLAAHFMVILHRGKKLYGKEIGDVFGEVDGRWYFDSIWRDIAEAERDIIAEPVYVTLNLCRVLAFARDGLVLSKREGGQWGLQNLPPPYRRLAADALAEYAGAAPMTADQASRRAYAAYMLASIQRYGERFSMSERFLRNEMLLGPAAMEKLAGSHVCVVGLGGVGSWAAEALARSGVGELTLIDQDAYGESNINRQLGALTSTVGQGKAEAMARRVLDINPACAVHPVAGRYCREDRDRFFGPYDYLVDAIDLVSCKVDLICAALERGIPVLSALGTGNKLDPSRLEVADLSKTRGCPLARVMRRELGRLGIKHLKVVYSSEEPAPCAQLEAPPPGRRSVPGSVPWVPPVAGLMLGGQVVLDLVGDLLPEKNREGTQ